MARKKTIKKSSADVCYDVPITIGYDINRVVGHATFYKNRLPKKSDFDLILAIKCKGNFDKNIVKDYQIESIGLINHEKHK